MSEQEKEAGIPPHNAQEMIERLRVQQQARQSRLFGVRQPGQPVSVNPDDDVPPVEIRMPGEEPPHPAILSGVSKVATPRREQQRIPDPRREKDGEMRMSKDGGKRMPLPPRLLDTSGPRMARGFIGADRVWENNAKFLSIPGMFFFLTDFSSTAMGVVTMVDLVTNGKVSPVWWLVAGAIAIYTIYAQLVTGPALWFSLRHRGEIVKRQIRNRKTGVAEEVTYVVDVDWANALLYIVHAVPDMVLTVLFFWGRIVNPLLVALSGEHGPSSGAKGIGVTLCIFVAVLASVIPLVILIRGDVKSKTASEAQG